MFVNDMDNTFGLAQIHQSMADQPGRKIYLHNIY